MSSCSNVPRMRSTAFFCRSADFRASLLLISFAALIKPAFLDGKRRILVITPSNLRKQWYQELNEKFFLPCCLLETKSYNEAVKHGRLRPFEAPEIVICSYHFARSKADDIQSTPWDLVVIDEAHRLRNV
ncbi:MAG: SNF2-related protein [Syntrophales bacterium]